MSVRSPNISPPPLKRRRVSLSLPESSAVPPSALSKPAQDTNVLRIYSWNVNGIVPFLPTNTPSITNFFASTAATNVKQIRQTSSLSLRACLRRWQWPDIVGLQEVKIAPTDAKTQATIRRSVNSTLEEENENEISRPLYDVHFCLPRDKHNGTGFGGKVYGVCTLVKRDNQGVKIRTVEWDLEGRVLISEMPNVQLVVINVYAVNGTDYDYRDPKTGKVVGTRHDRKRAFHTLLSHEVKSYKTQGWHVIVAGDLNISRTTNDSFPQLRMGEEHVRNRADFEQKFIVQLGMLDTFRLLHGDKKKYTYRPPSKPWGAGGDRVDMILATKGLEGKIVESDMLDTEGERGPSDHVPLFVAVSFGVDVSMRSSPSSSARGQKAG